MNVIHCPMQGNRVTVLVLLYVICWCSGSSLTPFEEASMEGSGEDLSLLLDSASIYFAFSSVSMVTIMTTPTDDSTTGLLMPFTSEQSMLTTSSRLAPPTSSSSSSVESTSSFHSSITMSPTSSQLLSSASSQFHSSSVLLSSSSLTTPPQSSIRESTFSVTPSSISSSAPATIIPYVTSLSSRKLFSSETSLFSETSSSSRTPFTSGAPLSLSPPVSPSQTVSSIRPSSTPPPMGDGRVPVVTVEPLNATAVRVSWTRVAGSNGYVIYVREEESSKRKRQAEEEEIIIRIAGGRVTSHVINDLKPFTTYTVSMASIDMNGVVGPRSEPTTPLTTDEAAPSSPRNVTWENVGDNIVRISWLPPEFPNGVITGYFVVLVLNNGSRTQYTVSGNQSMLNVSRPSMGFTVIVSAVNSAGTGSFQNGTMIVPLDEEVPLGDNRAISAGVVAVIVIFSLLFVLIVITTLVTVLILWWRRWYKYHGGADINVDEIEYKSGHLANFESSTDEMDDGQLTAKRWMRANANYSVPSLLLPPISELVDRYRTAEDVVESKTIFRPQVSATLGTIGETSAPTKEGPPSANSSSERSCEAPSTLSSVCSKTLQEANKVVVQPAVEEPVPNRDSRLENDDQALFDMMETVYLANPLESDSFKTLELQDPAAVLDIKEQVGLGKTTKIMRACVTSSCSPQLQRGSEVAVKMLDDEADDRSKDSFLGAAYILMQFSHQNILPLLGIRTASLPLMAVFSFISLGDLKHYLTRVRRRTRLESQPCDFGMKEQLFISFQIASGMEYLASKFFIHRALQAKYILLDEDHNIKISGFHSSHTLAWPGGYFDLKAAGYLPVKWLSIETLTNGKFSSNTDIWSFGVVLWEIFAFGLTPFRGVQNDDVLGHLKEGKRLNKPSGCPDDIYSLMLHCWVENARERPDFSTLHTHLLTIYNTHKREERTKRRVESPPVTIPETIAELDTMIAAGSSIPQNDTNDENGSGVANDLNQETEDSESLSADNSRANLCPDDHLSDQNCIRKMSAKNCDLVLTATNGYSAEVELSPSDHVVDGENDTSTDELYTRL